MQSDPPKVLLVDDDKHIRRNIEKMIERYGYSITTSGDAQSGLDTFIKDKFDIIILDVMMPDWTGSLSRRSGVDLLNEIRKINPKVPIIMLTSSTTIQLAVESMKLGANDYIQKGDITSEDFIEKINSLLISNNLTKTDKEISLTDSNPQISEKNSLQNWLIERSYGILDELVAGILLTGILYVLGVIFGVIEWSPLTWLSNPGSIFYIGIGFLTVIILLFIYVIWQRRQRRKK